MTKTAALYSFWSGFGVPAYDEASVPSGDNAPEFPYITYQVSSADFGSPVSLTGSIWYRSTSWVEANAKAEEIGTAISRGGCLLRYSGGAIWVIRGTPFSQSMGDPADDLIKRKIINITAEFISEN